MRWFRTIVTVALTASMAGFGLAVAGGAPAGAADHPAAPFDTTFNGSGLVVTRLDQQALTAQDVVVQPDGAVLVAAPIVFPQGQGALLARYTPSGGLDPAFGTGGVAAIPEGHTGGLVLDSQRRIVSGGNAEVVRLLPNGTPDPSFTSADLSPLRITGVAVLPDDRIVAVGQRIDPSNTRVQLVVARLLATGALDPTFNPTGPTPGTITYEPFGKIGAAVQGVALQPDGSVVTAGVTTANGATEGFVVRFTPGGAVDASFGGPGSSGAIFLAATEFNDVAVDAAGRVLAAGTSTDASGDGTVVRLTAAGVPDTTFATSGVARIDGLVTTNGITTTASGQVLVAASETTGVSRTRPVVVRLNPDGSSDRTWSSTGLDPGRVAFDVLGASTSHAEDVALAPDGKVVVVGTGSNPPFQDSEAFVARFPATTATAGDGFNAIAPNRVLDTRVGLGAPQGKLQPGTALHLAVAGTAGIPAQGASAVVMNLTATEPDRPGWVAAYPCDQPAPATSNLNYAAGQTIPNLVTVPVAADGTVCLITLSPTHVVADTFGWYGSTGTGFNAVGPIRLVDTRAGVGVTAGKLAAATQLKVKVAGAGGLPTSGVTAATFNVTVTEPDRAGFLTAFACGSPPPATSNLNFVAGQTIANLVTVPVGTDGSVCFSTVAPSSAVHVVVDLFGWYGATGAGFNGVAPRRLLDTRIGLGAAKAKLQPGTPIKLQVAGGSSGLPAGGVSAVTLNLTATDPDRAGWLAAYPCDQPLPGTSNVNYLAGQTIPNSVTVPVAEDGTVCIATLSPTNVVADLFGWFSNS